MDVDDDDKPIMSLIAEKKTQIKKENGHKEDDDDDDKPISALIAEKKIIPIKKEDDKNDTGKTTVPVKQEITQASTSSSLTKAAVDDGTNSDSDDDIPIVEFIKKRNLEKAAHKASLDKKAKLEVTNKKKSSSSSTKSSNSNGNGKSSSSSSSSTTGNSSNGSNNNTAGNSSWNSDSLECEFYTQTDKGRLIQTFLRRWWYSYEWPQLSQLRGPPKGFETLDGFPGVYVSTRTDSLGQVLDMRDPNTCPCLSTFVKKPSAEIKELCVSALENQIKQLVEVEGEDIKLVMELKKELNEMKKIDPAIADKSGAKYVNAFDVHGLNKTSNGNSKSNDNDSAKDDE